MTRVLVTGGAGFISSNFIRHLLEETDHEVVTLDALSGVQLAAHVSSISMLGTDSNGVVSYDAAASEGEANAALTRQIATTLGVPPRDVSLAAGAGARLKRVRVAGADATHAAMLEKICAIG